MTKQSREKWQEGQKRTEVWRKGRGEREVKGGKGRKLGNILYFYKKNAQFFSVKLSTGSYQTAAPPATVEGQLGGRNSVQNNGAWVSDTDHPIAVGHMELPTTCHCSLPPEDKIKQNLLSHFTICYNLVP